MILHARLLLIIRKAASILLVKLTIATAKQITIRYSCLRYNGIEHQGYFEQI